MSENIKMGKSIKKRKKGVEALRSRYGRLFVLPWEIGLVLFFIIPLISSIIYSFSSVVLQSGVHSEFVGLKWYKYVIYEDPTYLTTLKDTVLEFLVKLPITLALSLILAIILNQKFRGRIIARAIFFLPVIIATGTIIDFLSSSKIGIMLGTSGDTGTSAYGEMIDFEMILGNLGLPDGINEIISEYISSVFNLLWSCGIQIVLFISGLQTIPDSLYEVAKVEGCSKWEEFWYITFPMLGQNMLLVMVYTIIELFTAKTGIMKSAFGLMTGSLVYDRSMAMLWLYFAVVGIVMGIILAAYNKFCLKKWS